MEEGFEGHINTSRYAKLVKCSTDNALRDIQDLVTRGVFVQNLGGGRSTSYRLTDQVEEWGEVQEIRPLDLCTRLPKISTTNNSMPMSCPVTTFLLEK